MFSPIQQEPGRFEFVVLSFEGPDRYSLAGGLGVRATNLAQSLAQQGFRTHLIFIGDPDLPGVEESCAGRLVYHRWCQWISRYHPLGVYHGEEEKLRDFNQSIPGFIVEQIAQPAIQQGKYLIVLAEEWHTANALIALSDRLYSQGLRDHSILLWNANNTMGFERIDWKRLSYVSSITTVSRYMKQLMLAYGPESLVVPNGIPPDLLRPIYRGQVDCLRQTLAHDDELILFKVGRFDPAKNWWMAVETAARLKHSGENLRFLCRGGIEAHGVDVLNHARSLGLVVSDVNGQAENWNEAMKLIIASPRADVYNLKFFMNQEMLRVFYASADFVLANSKHEPFGLVGLEAMAAGGLVFTGPTGETYSASGEGAIALDTELPEELTLQIQYLRSQPERAAHIRHAAPRVARQYTWENILPILYEKIRLAACRQNVQAAALNL